MIKSMTGFASLSRDDERGAIGVTIRSVNHRFLDLQLRLPPAIADVEPRLRALVQQQLDAAASRSASRCSCGRCWRRRSS